MESDDPRAIRVRRRIRTPDFAEIYRRYQNSLQRQNAVDFSDIIMRTVNIFQDSSNIAMSWRSAWRHFTVDEVQDSNRARPALMRMLTDDCRPVDMEAAKKSNASVNFFNLRDFPKPSFAALGDDDQSIYAFRGVEPAVMRLLEKHVKAFARSISARPRDVSRPSSTRPTG